MIDGFGQTTRVTLRDAQENTQISATNSASSRLWAWM